MFVKENISKVTTDIQNKRQPHTLENAKTGMSLLCYSCLLGQSEIVKFLLESGFGILPSSSPPLFLLYIYEDTNEKSNGYTPLFVAAKHGHTQAVSILLSAKAHVDTLLEIPEFNGTVLMYTLSLSSASYFFYD